MITLLATVFVLSILVFVHEAGHFLFAKISRMRVERFSIGYPPRMTGKKIGETDYCISWIPFGGYVKIAGMVDESMNKKLAESEPQPWEFRSKPWISRFMVISAGSLMNIFFAFIIFVSTILITGVGTYSDKSIVGDVLKGKPAEKAGLLPGDRIVAIDEEEVDTWTELTEIVYDSPGKSLNIKYLRNDSLYSVSITPLPDKIINKGGIREVGLIGISLKGEMHPVGFGKAIIYGSQELYYLGKLIIMSLYKLITGQESIRSLGGPIAISKMAGESAKSGLLTLIGFMGLLSLNLGILNLLPIPVLDGGHIVYLIIEGIIRREIPVKVKLAIQQVGMVLIMALMVFVIYNDLFRLFGD